LFTVPATWQCVDHKNVVVPQGLVTIFFFFPLVL
jgi:hypothetical protein